MDDTLRTRIAAVFEAAALRDAGYSGDDLFRLADAVIRELGLRLDTTCHIHDRQGKQRCHRYVTEWTADE